MKQIIILLALFAVAGCGTQASPTAPPPAAANRTLLIDSSSMPVAAGKVTLIIGLLQRTNGVFTGDYQIKVAPYFWKHEKGRLSIAVSDVALADARQGKIVAVTGTAITSGKNGKRRSINITATPVDPNHGRLKVKFATESREMLFEPAYHFAENGVAAGLVQASEP